MNSTNSPMRIFSMMAILISTCCVSVFAQQDEVDKQEKAKASITKMLNRIEEIESEIETADLQRSHELKVEVYGLLGKVDGSYRQLKEIYQAKVAELNETVKERWQDIESATGDARKTIDRKIEKLQKEWDSSYEQLTEIHDLHLDYIKDEMYQLRGKLSEAAGKAESEFELTKVESVAQWERAHELILDLNKAYVAIVGQRMKVLREELLSDRTNAELKTQVDRVWARYLTAQKRFRTRNQSHLLHLDVELGRRQNQLAAAVTTAAKDQVRKAIQQVGARKHQTFEKVEWSLLGAIDALEESIGWANADLHHKQGDQKEKSQSQIEEWENQLATANQSLGKSYRQRIKFVDQQVVGIGKQMPDASENAAKQLTELSTKLKELSANLNEKAAVIAKETSQKFSR